MGIREELLNLILEQRARRGKTPPAGLPQLPARRTLPSIRWATEEARPSRALGPKYQIATQPVEARPMVGAPAQPLASTQVLAPRRQPMNVPWAADITAPEIQPEYAPTPWYQTALSKIAAPFEWLEEKVEEPVVRTILGKTEEEYDKWQKEHKLLAGISEFMVTLPLMFIPIGGLISKAGGAMVKAAAMAKMANTAQAIQSATDFTLAAGKMLNWPFEMVGKGVGKVFTTKPVKLMVNQSDEFVRFGTFDLKTVGQLADEASPIVLRDAWSKVPGFEWIIKKVDPSLLAKTPEARLTLGYMRYLQQAQTASIFHTLPFGKQQKARELFGFIDDTQRATKVVAKDVGKGFEANIENVLAHPERFNLTKPQLDWVQTYKQMGDDVTKLLQKENIFPEDMLYDYGEDGAHFWRVLKEYRDPTTGKVLEAKRTSMFTRGLHPKAKPRVISDYEGAIKGGYRYADPEQGLFIRTNQALEAVGYKDFLNNIIKLKGVKLPSEKAAKEILARNEFAKELRQLEYVGTRVGRFAAGGKLSKSQIGLLEQRRPGLAKILTEEAPGMPGFELLEVQNAVAQEIEVSRKMLANLAHKVEMAKGKSLKEASLWQPGIANRIMPRETAEHIARTIGPVGDKWLRIMSDVQGVTRMFQTGVDMGPLFIQGLPTAFSNPKAWGAMLKPAIGGLFDEKVFFRSLETPRMQELLKQLIPEGFTLNSAEFVEAAPLLEKMIGGAPGKFFGHWGRWFNFSVDYGRLVEAEALLMRPEIKAMGKEGVRAIVDHLGKKWGVMSTQWIGVPAGQRMAENAILFYSSRFTRSAFAMAKDVFRGELTGALARDMMAKFLFGMTVTYYGLSKALDQEPNLDPSSGKFMTVQIGDEHIGFGGSYIAIMRLLGNILQTTEEPAKFLSTSTRDQPFLRFFKSRLAPLTGTSIDILTGKTFIGEPLDTPLKKAEYAAIHGLMPFWLQSYVEGLVGMEPYVNPAQAMPPEFFGMRAWPTRLWERRDEMREHYAQLDHDKKWADLTVVQRREIEGKHSDLKSLTEEAWRDSLKGAIPSRAAYGAWREDREQANQEYEVALWDLQRQVNEGIKTPYDFRESYQKLALARRFTLDHIDNQPEYKDVLASLNEPRTEPEVLPQFEDLAYDIYVKLMFSGDLERGVDDYDYEEADRRKKWFISTYGQNVYDYVVARMRQGKNVPPLMLEYYEAQEVLRPYWEVREDADRYFGKMDSPNKQAFISRRRKALRTLNPIIARYYAQFYQRGE